ncbi:MAG TPA: ATP-dependent DNA helicase RecG [Burkholderiales bacterium]|nr:ATP-dependent DNA helicase RecG [Burkholderiales bacterium]
MPALAAARRRGVAAKKAAKPAKATQPAKAAAKSSDPATLQSRLAKLGLRRDFDLVLHLPLRYEDETRLATIADASSAQSAEPVQVQGRVVRTEVMYRPRRQLVSRIDDGSGVLVLRFFNFYGSQAAALAEGATVRAFGEVKSGFFGGEMIHPRFRVLRGEEPLPEALTPVYPAGAGLSQALLRKLIGRALEEQPLGEVLPEAVLAPLGMPSFRDAVLALHHPRPLGAGSTHSKSAGRREAEALRSRSHPAWRRMKFDELLAQQLSMRIHYRERRARSAPPLADAGTLTRQLIAKLPFTLTRAQARAWSEIAHDLAAPHPMHRLLQGDVGSGKTVVAALAALRAVENGWQAAVMAPTEILAEQHYRKFHEWLTPLGVKVAWLTGSQSTAERKRMLAEVEAGDTPVVVGTHALFQDKVRFSALALAIVDEQHRFGVAQRLALRKKGRNSGDTPAEPHQLMMSATPIPRTLSMSVYADLDVSVIDELPPGRKPVTTKLVADTRRLEVVRRIREACRAGRQAYWVCPLIEESETLDLQTALDTHAALTAEFPELRVGLAHGRLAPAEKAQVMQDFVAGNTHLLVATTVIEVGVDVPNASMMVIEHAERFGLAQLHQLRGRVGRGTAESACILLFQNPLSGNARARLKTIFESQDGFAIAEADLRLRGPGEYLGSRQSGAPLLRFADLVEDASLVATARETAEMLLDRHPDAARRHLERWLGGRSEFMKA